MLTLFSRVLQVALDYILDKIVQEKLLTSQDSWPFLKPVTGKMARDYLEVVHTPMDLATLAKKVKSKYQSCSRCMYFSHVMLRQ